MSENYIRLVSPGEIQISDSCGLVSFDYSFRVECLQAAMAAQEVDVALFSVGADLPYLIGYEAMASERLTVLVVRSGGKPILLVPELEAPRVATGDFDVVPWQETDHPIAIVGSVSDGPTRVAVGEHMWSVFLLGFQDMWPEASWTAGSELTAELRMRKDAEEIEALRNAAHGVDRVMGRIPEDVVFAGRTEREVARVLAEMTVAEGHDVAAFAIVASGPNAASPHHEPSNRVIEVGDVVVCDFGGRWDGYFSDSTRTFVVGVASERQIEVHGAVLAANEAGRAAASPGVSCEEVDRAARSVIQEAGFGEFFIHRTGHGIGLEVHESPYIVEGNMRRLESGIAFSVEPGIYIPGEFGVRIEDIVVCGEATLDELNRSDRSLVEVA